MTSQFSSIELKPDDPILGIPVLFNQDRHPQKVNLSIGAYQDEQGKAVVFSSVRKAERGIWEGHLDKEYLPIVGLDALLTQMMPMILGDSLYKQHAERISSCQTIGGTGALRIGIDFLTQNGFTPIYLPMQTWANHHLICQYARIKTSSYPYYDPHTHRLDYAGVCAQVQQMAKGSVMLLHASCHNPTGIDLSREQWQELSQMLQKQQVIPFFDLSYQGFGEGLEEDAYPVRYFLEQGHELFIAYSCSKNFGLYGERVGVLAFISQQPSITQKATSQIKQLVRSSYSEPPLQGARIVTTILKDQSLTHEWLQELAVIRNRIRILRQNLITELSKQGSSHDFSFIREQKGLFSYLGISSEQVLRLRKEYGIYLTGNGRINMAGLNAHNIAYVAQALLAVI